MLNKAAFIWSKIAKPKNYYNLKYLLIWYILKSNLNADLLFKHLLFLFKNDCVAIIV